MEELIGLLIAAAIFLFKFIGKRLEQSGNSDKARKLREFAEALNDDDSPMPDWEYLGKVSSDDVIEAHKLVLPEPETVVEVKPLPVSEPPKPLKIRKSVPEEVVPQKKNERIDPKKLVVYSEIMKPKFKE